MSFGQGGPYGPEGSHSQTPDWDALADDAEESGRRRRWMIIGGGALATLVIAGIVATVVVTSNDKGDDGKSQTLPSPDLPSEDVQPEPTLPDITPPAPPNPREFIASAEKDTAPLGANTLFPGSKMTMGGRAYTKGATAATNNCASATSASLGSALTGNGCTQVIRATYTKDGVAVTVGIAVFDTQAQAMKAKDQASGNVQSLAGDGVPSFCRATSCRLTTNAVGRYAYFTVAGYTSGKAVTASETQARQAGLDLANFTFRRIVARGEAQASAAATAQTG